MSPVTWASRLLTSCLGIGFVWPPGTWGSLLGVALFWTLLAARPVAVQAVATLVVIVVGVLAATRVSRSLATEDPSEVVVDELAGMWVALLGTSGWGSGVLAFFLFRFFDIAKPFPVRQAEALPAGWGIMADDVLAGLYALALVHLVAPWLPI